jgi:regulator of replication initiation timing
MPFKLAMGSEMSRRQFHACAQEVFVEKERLEAQVATLKADPNSWQSGYDEGRKMGTKTALAERDQLKAENEALRKALMNVMTQVDGNIRETVRDCVNGHDDVQDIYGYCDSIEGIIDAAMSKEAQS